VRFEWWAAPVTIEGDRAVTGLRCVRMRPIDDGSIRAVTGSEFVLECDMVILAVGQEKRLAWLAGIPGLHVEDGRVWVDPGTGMTSLPGLFAGGDCANGGKEVVNAVAEGKLAAAGIDRWIRERAGRR
jgi:glutamate synthase (NADPH/NADH) small chain